MLGLFLWSLLIIGGIVTIINLVLCAALDEWDMFVPAEFIFLLVAIALSVLMMFVGNADNNWHNHCNQIGGTVKHIYLSNLCIDKDGRLLDTQ